MITSPQRILGVIRVVTLAASQGIFFLACSSSMPDTQRTEEKTGWTGNVTLQQIEELRKIEGLLPVQPDTLLALYKKYDPATFYNAFQPRIIALGHLIDTLNHPLPAALRIDTLSLDHTIENIGEAAIGVKTLYLSSSYFYLFTSPEICRSVVTHEFGHIYYHLLDSASRTAFDTTWEEIQRAALFYLFRDGEYAGNARFGGHPEDSPAELFASAFNLLRNRPDELSFRTSYLTIPDQRLVVQVQNIVTRMTSR